MHARQRFRLQQLDMRIADAEEELRVELEIEKAIGKTTLLMSRVIVKKIAALYRQRTNLEKITRERSSKRKVYEDVLREREQAVVDAEVKLAEVTTIDINLRAAQHLTKDPDYAENRRFYSRLKHSKAVILANRKRALTNWLNKTESMLPVNNRVRDEVVERAAIAHQNLNNFDPIASLINDPMEQLKNDPRWDKNPAINTANTDMLMRPEEKEQQQQTNEEAEVDPFKLTEPHKFIIIGD